MSQNYICKLSPFAYGLLLVWGEESRNSFVGAAILPTLLPTRELVQRAAYDLRHHNHLVPLQKYSTQSNLYAMQINYYFPVCDIHKGGPH